MLTLALAALALLPGAEDPIIYTVRFPDPAAHTAVVEVSIPATGRPSVEIVMPRWSPGFYRVEDYAAQVKDLSARAGSGELPVEHPAANRWTVRADGPVSVRYTLTCEAQSVTTNWVGPGLVVLNGPATFPFFAGLEHRPCEVRVELPAGWARSASGMPSAGRENTYRAADYETLADSPIVAGGLELAEFEVAGVKHTVVTAGDSAGWDAARAAGDYRKIVEENRRFWGTLPFDRYVFLSVFRAGGGGLEHRNSTLLTSNAGAMKSAGGYRGWLRFVGHEYFHTFNVKRVRPVELGPFDYEHEPRTSGLWIAEGVTAYYDGLLNTRAGLAGAEDFLAALSDSVERLQKSPGRKVQSLERASLDVWTTSFSGMGGGDTTISYYTKGAVAAFLLDARVRTASRGAKSLDDVMRAALAKYGGAKGFTAAEFRRLCSDTAGEDLTAGFARAIGSTEELDYAEGLACFGLRFAPDGEGRPTWRLEGDPAATAEQSARRASWLGPSGPAVSGPPSR